MSDDSLPASYDITPRPIPDVGPDHAAVRPGLVAPHPPSREDVELGTSISQRVWQANNLRRIAVNWRHDAMWPRLRDALKADYATLLDLDSNSAIYLRGQIEQLLQIRSTNSDTARLDALLAWLNNGAAGHPWTRNSVDRLMEGHTP